MGPFLVSEWKRFKVQTRDPVPVSFIGDVMLAASSGLRWLSCLAHLSYLRRYERRVGPRVIYICIYLYFKNFIFIYFWLYWIFIAVHGLSLVVAPGGYPLVVVHRLLIAVASLIVEHGLSGFRSCRAWVLDHGLSSFGTPA